jgi:mannose-6-phosphate isomerase-like protein (cupin superfamily)
MPGHVTVEAEAEPRPGDDGDATTRVTIGAESGCALEQRIVRFRPGRSRRRGDQRREELLFAVAGEGTLVLDGTAHPLAGETCARVAPGVPYEIENPGPGERTGASSRR